MLDDFTEPADGATTTVSGQDEVLREGGREGGRVSRKKKGESAASLPTMDRDERGGGREVGRKGRTCSKCRK